MIVFYSTLSAQKCTKLNTEKQNSQGYPESNLTPERENRNFRKTVITNSTKALADLEDTCNDKVTNFGVVVRYTKKVIKKIEDWGQT
jgi:hypothetical protein